MAKSIPNKLIPNDMSLTDDIIISAAEKYGTPLYIYDQYKLEKNWNNLTACLPENTKIFYSVKANPNFGVIKTMANLGANFEVASIGELKAVQHVGVSPSRIIFVGPGKSKKELFYAIENDVNVIVSESQGEIDNIQMISQRLQKNVHVALRINPGIGQGVLSMGGITQFGMEVNTALNILLNKRKYPSIEIVGLHGYLGSELLNWRNIISQSELILNIADELQQKSGSDFSFVDLGGGFGIPYHETDESLDLSALHTGLLELISGYSCKFPNTETIAFESGRFLVGSAGVFVTRVLEIKENHGHCFVILDGGINVFGGFDRYVGSRPTPLRSLENEGKEKSEITFCGPLCTPLDRLAANVVSPVPLCDSLVVFYLAGAYGYSASPGLFLSHGYPCEVMFTREKINLVRRRVSPEEFL